MVKQSTLASIRITKPFWQSLSLGLLAGMRSASAPAITSHILSHHQSNALADSPLKFMQSEKVATALKFFAVQELVADKLPGVPDRIKPISVAFRVTSGALSGASIYKANGGNTVIGALIGGSAAAASTFASFFIRKATVKHTTIIDPIIGSLEDVLVVGAGVGLSRTA
jgi:uncharacterized membrane protein